MDGQARPSRCGLLSALLRIGIGISECREMGENKRKTVSNRMCVINATETNWMCAGELGTQIFTKKKTYRGGSKNSCQEMITKVGRKCIF